MIDKIIGKPKIIGIVANVNEGKSNLLYYLIETIKLKRKFNLFAYGLRNKLAKCYGFYSVEELEKIKDSLIIIDEFMNIFDLDNRKQKRQIENTLRLINHNNNILILSGVPENFKKFISNKLNMIIYKRTSFGDFINGSRIKRICLDYCGLEKGSNILNLDIDEALFFDGKTYQKFKIPYLRKYDTKLKNQEIFKKRSPKRAEKMCRKSVPKRA